MAIYIKRTINNHFSCRKVMQGNAIGNESTIICKISAFSRSFEWNADEMSIILLFYDFLSTRVWFRDFSIFHLVFLSYNSTSQSQIPAFFQWISRIFFIYFSFCHKRYNKLLPQRNILASNAWCNVQYTIVQIRWIQNYLLEYAERRLHL